MWYLWRMTPTRQGAFRLFGVAGIDIYLHWSWFLVATFVVSNRGDRYSSLAWNVLEYLALFMIVLLHELGHALACRQVGGRANEIVLWPLGGVAYVAPPPRPGATLWSLAAGPLVNLVLLPVLTLLWWLARSGGWMESLPDAYGFLRALWFINVALLVFNLLPIYPLDGGQILRCLLWFALGATRSLMVASLVGLVGVALLVMLALWEGSIWLGVLSAFILLNCWKALQQARAMSRAAAVPRRAGFACPVCKRPPPTGAFWVCGKCRTPFDTFQNHRACPNCGEQFPATQCLECGASRPILEWMTGESVPPRL